MGSQWSQCMFLSSCRMGPGKGYHDVSCQSPTCLLESAIPASPSREPLQGPDLPTQQSAPQWAALQGTVEERRTEGERGWTGLLRSSYKTIVTQRQQLRFKHDPVKSHINSDFFFKKKRHMLIVVGSLIKGTCRGSAEEELSLNEQLTALLLKCIAILEGVPPRRKER